MKLEKKFEEFSMVSWFYSIFTTLWFFILGKVGTDESFLLLANTGAAEGNSPLEVLFDSNWFSVVFVFSLVSAPILTTFMGLLKSVLSLSS